MMRCARATILLGLVPLLLLGSSDALALRTNTRDGYMVGLGFGFGGADFTTGAGNEIQLRRGSAPMIRFGKTFDSRFAVLVDYTGWLIEDGNIDVKYRRSFQNIGLSLTWYPAGDQPAWGGLSFRGGAGYGWGSVAEVPLSVDEDGEIVQGHGERIDEGGLGLVFSMGYEFRLVDRFALGLALNANYPSLNSYYYDTALTFPVTVNGSWYW